MVHATDQDGEKDDLTRAVEKVADELSALREAVDELHEDVQWLLQNPQHFGGLQQTMHEISDDVQVLVRRAFQRPSDVPETFDKRTQKNTCAPLPPLHPAKETVPTPPPMEAKPETTHAEPVADESPPHAQPTAPRSESVSESAAAGSDIPARDSPSGKKRQAQPLSVRLSFQRHMTDIVRAIGYEVLTHDEARSRLRPLVERYGRAAIEPAAEELLEVEENGAAVTVRLRDHVRQLARPLLGRPPETASAQTQGPSAAKSQSIVVPVTDVSRLKAIKLSRQQALANFRAHLESRGLAFEQIDEVTRRAYTTKHLAALDFIVREKGEPPQLISLRKSVTETQRHDLAEWKLLLGDHAIVSLIWRYRDSAGRESWESIELDVSPRG